jgi:hypothetical protein
MSQEMGGGAVRRPMADKAMFIYDLRLTIGLNEGSKS